MNKKIQVNLSNEAWNHLEGLLKQLKDEHKSISINCSELVSEIILSSKIDLKSLQVKYTNLRKSLRELSNMKDIDLDVMIKSLVELKNKTGKKNAKPTLSSEDVTNE